MGENVVICGSQFYSKIKAKCILYTKEMLKPKGAVSSRVVNIQTSYINQKITQRTTHLLIPHYTPLK